MKKRLLAMLLAIVMVFSLLPVSAFAEAVDYAALTNQEVKVLEDTDTRWAGIYYVNSTLEIDSPIIMLADTTIILGENADLKLNAGINRQYTQGTGSDFYNLTVFCQKDATNGKLTVFGSSGGGNAIDGSLTVYGGTVNIAGGDGVENGSNGAQDGGDGVTDGLTVYDGKVNITGGNSGFGNGGAGVIGAVQIIGGTVNINGGDGAQLGGCGVNGEARCPFIAFDGDITIQGGDGDYEDGVGINCPSKLSVLRDAEVTVSTGTKHEGKKT